MSASGSPPNARALRDDSASRKSMTLTVDVHASSTPKQKLWPKPAVAARERRAPRRTASNSSGPRSTLAPFLYRQPNATSSALEAAGARPALEDDRGLGAQDHLRALGLSVHLPPPSRTRATRDGGEGDDEQGRREEGGEQALVMPQGYAPDSLGMRRNRRMDRDGARHTTGVGSATCVPSTSTTSASSA